mmetsp:Transcript_108625/g.306210  ORF Transcript_108625/g.306210 Transcript_108625/m.306210 type:complete len:90 (-) Transcript_108625:168-437(-)
MAITLVRLRCQGIALCTWYVLRNTRMAMMPPCDGNSDRLTSGKGSRTMEVVHKDIRAPPPDDSTVPPRAKGKGAARKGKALVALPRTQS